MDVEMKPIEKMHLGGKGKGVVVHLRVPNSTYVAIRKESHASLKSINLILNEIVEEYLGIPRRRGQ